MESSGQKVSRTDKEAPNILGPVKSPNPSLVNLSPSAYLNKAGRRTPSFSSYTMPESFSPLADLGPVRASSIQRIEERRLRGRPTPGNPCFDNMAPISKPVTRNASAIRMDRLNSMGRHHLSATTTRDIWEQEAAETPPESHKTRSFSRPSKQTSNGRGRSRIYNSQPTLHKKVAGTHEGRTVYNAVNANARRTVSSRQMSIGEIHLSASILFKRRVGDAGGRSRHRRFQSQADIPLTPIFQPAKSADNGSLYIPSKVSKSKSEEIPARTRRPTKYRLLFSSSQAPWNRGHELATIPEEVSDSTPTLPVEIKGSNISAHTRRVSFNKKSTKFSFVATQQLKKLPSPATTDDDTASSQPEATPAGTRTDSTKERGDNSNIIPPKVSDISTEEDSAQRSTPRQGIPLQAPILWNEKKRLTTSQCLTFIYGFALLGVLVALLANPFEPVASWTVLLAMGVGGMIGFMICLVLQVPYFWKDWSKQDYFVCLKNCVSYGVL